MPLQEIPVAHGSHWRGCSVRAIGFPKNNGDVLRCFRCPLGRFLTNLSSDGARGGTGWGPARKLLAVRVPGGDVRTQLALVRLSPMGGCKFWKRGGSFMVYMSLHFIA